METTTKITGKKVIKFAFFNMPFPRPKENYFIAIVVEMDSKLAYAQIFYLSHIIYISIILAYVKY